MHTGGKGSAKTTLSSSSAIPIHTCHWACFRHAGHVQGGLVLSLSSHGSMLRQVKPVSASPRKVIPYQHFFFIWRWLYEVFLTSMPVTKSFTATKDKRNYIASFLGCKEFECCLYVIGHTCCFLCILISCFVFITKEIKLKVCISKFCSPQATQMQTLKKTFGSFPTWLLSPWVWCEIQHVLFLSAPKVLRRFLLWGQSGVHWFSPVFWGETPVFAGTLGV